MNQGENPPEESRIGCGPIERFDLWDSGEKAKNMVWNGNRVVVVTLTWFWVGSQPQTVINKRENALEMDDRLPDRGIKYGFGSKIWEMWL